MTTAEEDRIIANFGGSRTGVAAMRPVGPPVLVGGVPTWPEERDSDVTILLPDPNVRTAHRAQGFGGPTTEGEPSYTWYYRKYYGKEPAAELVQLDVETEDFVVASDGREVKISLLDWYEGDIVEHPEHRLDAPTFDAEAEYPKFVDHEDKGYNKSISDLMKGDE